MRIKFRSDDPTKPPVPAAAVVEEGRVKLNNTPSYVWATAYRHCEPLTVYVELFWATARGHPESCEVEM